MIKNFIYQHEEILVQHYTNAINANSCLLFSLNVDNGGSRISQTVGVGAGISPTLEVSHQPIILQHSCQKILHENERNGPKSPYCPIGSTSQFN